MSKNCEQCNNPFEDISKSGHEQKYCSITCRYKSANIRRENKIKQETINSINNESTKHQVNDTRQNDNGVNGNNSFTLPNRAIDYLGQDLPFRSNNIQTNENFNTTRSFATQENNGIGAHYIGILEKYFDTRSENKFIVSELMREKEKVIKLQKELDEIYAEDEENENEAEAEKPKTIPEQYLKIIMEGFREDPATMTNMVKTLVPAFIGGITDMFKSKTA